LSATPLKGFSVNEPSTVKLENSIVWQVVPKTEQFGTSGTSVAVVVVSVEGADGDAIVSGVEVVEESDDADASFGVLVAYTVVKIFESTNETTSCATADAIGAICPTILVVVPASEAALDDASFEAGNSMMVSVAGVLSVGAVQSLVDALAISNAAACNALTDGSESDVGFDESFVVLEVVDAELDVALSSLVGGSITGSGNESEDVAVGAVDELLSSADDELVSVVGGTVVVGGVGSGVVTVSSTGAGGIAEAASSMDAEF
jgi:hypothetical protein